MNSDSLILHPALLIASGYECITSKDARFLNGYKRHFTNPAEDKTIVRALSTEDFAIGGILNPSGDFLHCPTIFRECTSGIHSFPFLNKNEIYRYFYLEIFNRLMEKIEFELFRDLDSYLSQIQKPASFLRSGSNAIRSMQKSDVYNKIAALHMCGLGDKLRNAFEIVFRDYHNYSESRNDREKH